jgi:hypothetical protein
LASVGLSIVASDSDAYPFTFAGMIVTFGKTIPPADEFGYSPEDPIIEVLGDVGVLIEPDAYWVRPSQDADAAWYVVTFTDEEHPTGSPH